MSKHDWKVGDQALIARHKAFGENKSESNSMGRIVYIRDDGIVDLIACDGEFRSGVLSDLDPLPTETPKDPFAPGEYVTCCAVGRRHPRKEGETVQCIESPDFKGPWFAYYPIDEYVADKKSRFRPATPEEIAAYKAKYEAEPAVDPQPKTYTLTPYIKPETIMLHGVEYLVTENM